MAPLNWGLGHATRCIPIIHALLRHGFTPVIASDGAALVLLKKEFPDLVFDELPGYNVTYSAKASQFKWKLFKDSPKFLKAITAEKKATQFLVNTYKIDGIISDNRLGVYCKKVRCVFITHQLNVLSGNTTWFSTKIHQNIIKKFDECWIPDHEFEPNLSGKLGHEDNTRIVKKYLGPLSRFKKQKQDNQYDVMVLLSGPEPQRTLLEKKIINELKAYNGKVLFVKGIIEKEQIITRVGLVCYYNFMESHQLEKAINSSSVVLSRSGYTTVMDLAKIGKKAFFIPTPGQFEQEYLAKRFEDLKMVPTCNQEDFKIEMLEQVKNYSGLEINSASLNFSTLFRLFQSE